MRTETHDPIDRARSIAGRALPPGAPHTRVLQGEWLGHPLHPMLTDLPVGFWTSAWILDLFGGESGRRASQRLVGAGVMSVLPTALAGGADWTRRPRPDQRLGLLHAGAVAAATSVYAASWVARRRGSHRAGVVLGHVGAGLATFGGYLGGHLAFDPPANDQTRSDRSRDGE